MGTIDILTVILYVVGFLALVLVAVSARKVGWL